MKLQATKSVAKNVNGIVTKNTGHFVPEERPEELVGLIQNFLK